MSPIRTHTRAFRRHRGHKHDRLGFGCGPDFGDTAVIHVGNAPNAKNAPGLWLWMVIAILAGVLIFYSFATDRDRALERTTGRLISLPHGIR